MFNTQKEVVPIQHYSGDDRESVKAFSLAFSDCRVIKETMGGLARHDIEVKCSDGEWRRIGKVMESENYEELLNND